MGPSAAYELSTTLEWLNAEPQRLAAHRGRVVALLFWSASSVYCHNLLHGFAAIQRKYPDALSVLAIHLPKFDAERDAATLQEALRRLDVHLPVANDRDWAVWQHYALQSWPTTVLIDHQGMRAGDFAGDDQLPAIEILLQELIAKAGAIPPKPAGLHVRPGHKQFAALNCPGGLALADGKLYIADTGHHRVLECTPDGRVQRVFGNGIPLFLDGPAGDACFNRPSGMDVYRGHLYVADTGNHAVRRIDLRHGGVDTVLGDGKPGVSHGYGDDSAAPRINNPTALCVRDDALVVADAGNNRLALYNLASHAFTTLAGSGSLGLLDGVGARTKLAHPLALAGGGSQLYVAEGSTSSVRSVAVPEGRINTVLGQGLYQFGDVDGPRQSAALQHPRALAVDDKRGVIWIADAYNGKIRMLGMNNNQLSTLALMQTLRQPSALALDGESLWIADGAGDRVYRYFFESEFLSRLNIQMA